MLDITEICWLLQMLSLLLTSAAVLVMHSPEAMCVAVFGRLRDALVPTLKRVLPR